MHEEYKVTDPQLAVGKVITADLPCTVDSMQAAKVLGITCKTLTNWRSLGIGPQFIQYDGRNGAVRYRLADLVAWQEARRRNGPSGDSGGSNA
jgi:hypothetical protein